MDLTAWDLFNLLSAESPATEGENTLASFILQQTSSSPASASDTSGKASSSSAMTAAGSSDLSRSRPEPVKPPTADHIHANAIRSFAASELQNLHEISSSSIVWPETSFLSISLPEWLKGGEIAMGKNWDKWSDVASEADQLEFRLGSAG